jgi:hypothetical protein
MFTFHRTIALGSQAVARLALLLFAGEAQAADLIGTVLHGSGPMRSVPVTLRAGDRDVASATTDDAGRYVIRSLRPGVYDLQCGSRPAVRVRVNDGLNQIDCQG